MKKKGGFMTPHEIDLRREYEYETGIEFITVTGANTKKYVRWLENRLLSSSSNSDYAECADEIQVHYENHHDVYRCHIIDILKKYFA